MKTKDMPQKPTQSAALRKAVQSKLIRTFPASEEAQNVYSNKHVSQLLSGIKSEIEDMKDELKVCVEKEVRKCSETFIENVQTTRTKLRVIEQKLERDVDSLKYEAKTLYEENMKLKCDMLKMELMLFNVFETQNEDSLKLVHSFMYDEMGLNNLSIGDAYRVGKMKRHKPRPMVLVFWRVCDRDLVLRCKGRLAGTKFSLKPRLPVEIENKRRPLFQYERSLRRDGWQVSWNLDQLVVDGVGFTQYDIEGLEHYTARRRVGSSAGEAARSTTDNSTVIEPPNTNLSGTETANAGPNVEHRVDAEQSSVAVPQPTSAEPAVQINAETTVAQQLPPDVEMGSESEMISTDSESTFDASNLVSRTFQGAEKLSASGPSCNISVLPNANNVQSGIAPAKPCLSDGDSHSKK